MSTQRINPELFTRLVNLMSRGIIKRQVIRELVFNGIEASIRLANQLNLTPEEASKLIVRVQRDHVNRNKFAVINEGLPITEEDAENHLMNLANSGNVSENGETDRYDPNKGIGAKIALFPWWKYGLAMRAKYFEDETGLKFRAGTTEDGLYDFIYHHDDEEGLKTPFLACDKFDSILRESQGTEAVIMGNTPNDDTFAELNSECVMKGRGGKKNITGTGYGLVKYLQNLFWDPPPVNLGVQKYKEGTQRKTTVQNIKGLKHCMQLAVGGKKYWSFQIGDPEGVNLPEGIVAHVAFIPKWKDKGGNKGYISNSVNSGFVAFTFRGEVYHDITQHGATGLANVGACGLGGDPGRWIVVFEIPSDTEGVTTNLHRTGLQCDTFPQPGSLREHCQRAFSLIFEQEAPEIYSKNQESFNIDHNWAVDLNTYVRDFAKDPVFKEMKVTMSAEIKRRAAERRQSPGSRSTGKSSNSSNVAFRRGKRYNPFAKVRQTEPPMLRIAKERGLEVGYIMFDLGPQYSIDINPTHPTHVRRVKLVKEALRGNLKAKKIFDDHPISDEEIGNSIIKHCYREVFFRAVTVFLDENLKSAKDKRDRLCPANLADCWHYSSISDVVEMCIKSRKAALKAKKEN